MHQNLKKDVMELGGDIVESDRFAKAQDVIHHAKDRNIYNHSLKTAGLALSIARWLGRRGVAVSEEDTVRAGLLHDIGMTESSVSESPSYRKAFSHPREGVRIAREEFGANATQADAIRHHMWPIGIVPPKTPEGWAVLAADKLCSTTEAIIITKDKLGHAISTQISSLGKTRQERNGDGRQEHLGR